VIERLRRNAELTLLVLGGVIIGGSYALASLGSTASVPANIGPFLGLVLVLFVVAHVAVRKLAPGADGTLLPLAMVLNGIGFVFITRLDDGLALDQSLWTGVGIAVFVATLAVVKRPRDLERYRYMALFGGVALMLMPLLPVIGRNFNGARIWISVGGFSFQPGEAAKLLLAVFFAAYLVEKRELLALASWPRRFPILPDPKHLGPVLVAWGIAVVIITFERDLGTALLFFTLFIVLLWVATGRVAYLLVGFGMFAAAAFVSWTAFSHVQTRVTAWLDPFSDPQDAGYQVLQGSYALADGGLVGTGLGLGIGEVPEAENDFIFAVIGQELGLLGATAVLISFLLLIGSGLRVAAQTEGSFEKLLATGLTTLIGVQAFIIIGGVIRVLPLTGVTLPFMSFGGSSLLANYVLLALLVRISDESGRRARRREVEVDATVAELA
jgi:cell division protein FtsW (lipid II flippase)